MYTHYIHLVGHASVSPAVVRAPSSFCAQCSALASGFKPCASLSLAGFHFKQHAKQLLFWPLNADSVLLRSQGAPAHAQSTCKLVRVNKENTDMPWKHCPAPEKARPQNLLGLPLLHPYCPAWSHSSARVFSNCLKILPLWPLSLYLGMGEFPFEIKTL